jgi:transposase InsO family protein
MLDAEQKLKLLISNRPWEHEPDNEEWVDQDTGYKCTVRRHGMLGHLNGYVAIPKGHPLHGADYNKVDSDMVDAHGGLTYSNENKDTGEWVFGFDCAHGGDFNPMLVATLIEHTDTDIGYHMKDTYRTFEWVKEQVVDLASQLKLIERESK